MKREGMTTKEVLDYATNLNPLIMKDWGRWEEGLNRKFPTKSKPVYEADSFLIPKEIKIGLNLMIIEPLLL